MYHRCHGCKYSINVCDQITSRGIFLVFGIVQDKICHIDKLVEKKYRATVYTHQFLITNSSLKMKERVETHRNIVFFTAITLTIVYALHYFQQLEATTKIKFLRDNFLTVVDVDV